MPGHIIHLAAASQVLSTHQMDEDVANMFLLGTIVPDMFERNEKRFSHFWSKEVFKKFDRIPDLDAFLAKYENKMTNPFVLGYYGHLYMDVLFMKTSWKKHFLFYDKDHQPNDLFDEVAFIGYREAANDKEILYPREEFLSNDYYYGDYDCVNPYVIKTYNVKVPELPEVDVALIEEAIVHARDTRVARMIEAANYFKSMEVSDITAEMTDKKLKVFRLSEFRYLIEETSKQILKSI